MYIDKWQRTLLTILSSQTAKFGFSAMMSPDPVYMTGCALGSSYCSYSCKHCLYLAHALSVASYWFLCKFSGVGVKLCLLCYEILIDEISNRLLCMTKRFSNLAKWVISAVGADCWGRQPSCCDTQVRWVRKHFNRLALMINLLKVKFKVHLEVLPLAIYLTWIFWAFSEFSFTLPLFKPRHPP